MNETSHPERTEHLGITPLEAMSYGCITMCYRSGGIKEIVRDGENGYTFGQLPELTNKIITTSKDTAKQLEIRRNAIDTVTTLFSQKSFDENMTNLYRKFI